MNFDGKTVLKKVPTTPYDLSVCFINVIEEGEPIEYKGKKLHSEPSIVAQVEVTKVEPDFCYANIKNQKRPVKRDDKLEENIDDLTVKTKGHVIQ